MTAPRVVFLGNDAWSVPPLRALAESSTPPVLVITRSPRPAGRGSRPRPTDVARFAADAGLPLVEAERVRDGAGWEALRGAAPDVLAVVAYGELLTPAVLGVPAAGCLNLHFSLLPRWRGAAPVQRALMTGDTVTGVSVMVIDEGLDTGPVLRTVEEPIRLDDDAGALGARLAEVGAVALRDAIEPFAAGELAGTPQPSDGVTLAPKISPDERRIDWSRDAATIGRLVRALAPSPGASTRFRDAGLKVLRGRAERSSSATPGTIVEASSAGVLVATGDGAYRLEEVAPAGRRRMTADAWARGARFAPGERLG
jgi:methionyl-tRNA formyltransferase